jgi:predicted RNA-binding protein YlxR (DUF448 family)
VMAVRASRASDPDPDGLLGLQRPIRTCIGCRKRAEAAELLRVVAEPGSSPLRVVPDPRRCAPGRGAWLHPSAECAELAERRRAFARALRSPVPIDPSPVREYVAALHGDPTAEPRRS